MIVDKRGREIERFRREKEKRREAGKEKGREGGREEEKKATSITHTETNP